ncbi:hypothetical protein [Actinomadura harenae]|uniref:DUF4034 domain-containing protein n=1 Tax=Actinomadura harenae TaxID=2483351 RepID=A0A3M2M5N6_9ACTN|nr:hypothetical protein [Actinomadura harenae]RMI45064.1 hypothetical protein EBO15_10855 [Actinomadura harenae]
MPVDLVPPVLVPPVLDPTFGDPRARELAAATAQGDTALLRRVAAEDGDADRRSFLLGVAVDHPGRPDWMARWPEDEPDEPLAHLTRGVHGIAWAWEARGTARAESTGSDRFHEFSQRLAQAERDLLRAAELAPDDPEPWAYLVTTARGLQHGTGELCRRFAEVVARCPWHYRAHAMMLQGVAPKWSGSTRLMFNFARDRAAAAPEGSPLVALVVEAHTEAWLDDPAPESGHFADPAVRGELRAVAARLRQAPDAPMTPALARARNLLAFGFSQGNEPDSAAEQFAAIGPHVTESPWHYLPRDIVESFTEARNRAVKP